MKKFILGIIIIILVAVGSLLLYSNVKEEKVINMDGPQASLLLSQVDNQRKVNDRLNKISASKKYTLSDPYYELNPYKLSPLSAIVIFSTNDNTSVKVYINDVFVTTMEETTEHVIPIYGLYEDFDNKIKLVTDIGEKEIVIKTKKSNIEYPLNVEYAASTLNNEEMYFTVASYKTYLTGWDIEGKLRFYLTADNRMDVEWLDNGHFIIGTTQDQTREQFCGFVEMDYLGKIYNYYTMENGFSFESQILSDGSIMAAGGNEPIYMDEQVIYIMNPKTGEKISDINLSKIIKNIDSNFNPAYLGAGAIRNGFYYDETSKELLVSFREISTIFSFNYETKTLNWVFTDPTNEVFSNPVWQDYFVTINNGRYPLGQHTPQITKNGNIALFNNGYDRYGVFKQNKSDKVTEFKNAYSACEVYKIENKKANLVWQYNGDKKLFSIKYGLFRYNDDNTKLMNFGYILTDEYRRDENNSVKEAENIIDSMYAMILELDVNDNVLFKATSSEGKYRVFKHSLYNETTTNTNIKELKIFNTIKTDKLSRSNYKDVKLDGSQEWIYSFDLTKNTLTTNYQIVDTDKIDLYFVNKKGEIFILNYKKANNKKTKRVFNLDLNNDTYRVYVSLNDTLYKIDTIYVEKH